MNKIKELLKSKLFYISLVVLILGASLNQWSSYWLFNHQPNLPILSDLILDNIPYLRLQWIYDLIPVIAILVFCFYAYRNDFNRIPYFILIFGILQCLRGTFIVLTPFGRPCVENLGIFKTLAFRQGVYPSGHTGATFLAFLLTRDLKYKIFLLIMTFLVVIALFLARGHYSIDILSALIFAYALSCFGAKYFKNWKLGKNG